MQLRLDLRRERGTRTLRVAQHQLRFICSLKRRAGKLFVSLDVRQVSQTSFRHDGVLVKVGGNV
jgi:hypothetical protein